MIVLCEKQFRHKEKQESRSSYLASALRFFVHFATLKLPSARARGVMEGWARWKAENGGAFWVGTRLLQLHAAHQENRRFLLPFFLGCGILGI